MAPGIMRIGGVPRVTILTLGRSLEVLAGVVTASPRQRGVMAAESRGVAERRRAGGSDGRGNYPDQ